MNLPTFHLKNRRRDAGATKEADMTWVAGVDGYKNGWFVVLHEVRSGNVSCHTKQSFAELLRLRERPEVIAVDMPIGLLDAAQHGGRDCDVEARRLLGERRNCVFSPPVRTAISATDYESAKRANQESSSSNIGISQQAYGICWKIHEVDTLMTRKLQDRIFEVHPELCFLEMAGHPMKNSKKTEAGYCERKSFLPGFRNIIQELERQRPSKLKKDDILDACAACWTAVRIQSKPRRAIHVPANPPVDSKGLRIEIWR
jgi:predicted RNase H-like nuclease